MYNDDGLFISEFEMLKRSWCVRKNMIFSELLPLRKLFKVQTTRHKTVVDRLQQRTIRPTITIP